MQPLDQKLFIADPLDAHDEPVLALENDDLGLAAIGASQQGAQE